MELVRDSRDLKVPVNSLARNSHRQLRENGVSSARLTAICESERLETIQVDRPALDSEDNAIAFNYRYLLC